MSRSGLNRKTAHATLTLALAAEIPDVDVLLRLKGSVISFIHHRGFTHTFLGAPFMAGFALGIVYLISRSRGSSHSADSGSPSRWGLLYCYALLGVLSHLLLDFTNNYGLRPFDPFNSRWYSWDIVFIVDPIITTARLLMLIAPWFSGLISGEIGLTRVRFPGRGSPLPA